MGLTTPSILRAALPELSQSIPLDLASTRNRLFATAKSTAAKAAVGASDPVCEGSGRKRFSVSRKKAAAARVAGEF
jgi:hypothetical protein